MFSPGLEEWRMADFFSCGIVRDCPEDVKFLSEKRNVRTLNKIT